MSMERCLCEQGDHYHWRIVRHGTMWEEQCLGCRRIVDFGGTGPPASDQRMRLHYELRVMTLEIILNYLREFAVPMEVRNNDDNNGETSI